MRALLATAVVGSMALSFGSAGAVTLRTCPDGTKVADSEQCPKGKKLGTSGGQQQAQKPGKPKTDASAKKWRDYINGNPKPPIQPKS